MLTTSEAKKQASTSQTDILPHVRFWWARVTFCIHFRRKTNCAQITRFQPVISLAVFCQVSMREENCRRNCISLRFAFKRYTVFSQQSPHYLATEAERLTLSYQYYKKNRPYIVIKRSLTLVPIRRAAFKQTIRFYWPAGFFRRWFAKFVSFFGPFCHFVFLLAVAALCPARICNKSCEMTRKESCPQTVHDNNFESRLNFRDSTSKYKKEEVVGPNNVTWGNADEKCLTIML